MIEAVLFVCNMNSVRSPMAAALLKARPGRRITVDSAGVYEGALDPFVEAVLGEIGLAITGHEPKSLDAIRTEDFDLIVALTQDAALELARRTPPARVEFWDIENPSGASGGRNAILGAYREVRDELTRRIAARFKEQS
ncbi:MAG: hypothetical protein ABL957_04355 [Parvularculaceae bacterium]